MSGNYILRDGEVVECKDVIEWSKWFEKSERKIAKTTIGDLLVSTVFLSIDHSFGTGPPVLFETMVFRGESSKDEICERYTTLEEARAGHEAICERLRINAP